MRFNNLNNYKLFDQPFPIEITEVEPLEKFEIAPHLDAVALETPHTDESLAIHIRSRDDATLVYTGDTGFSETLAAFARRVDLLLIEASFPRNKPGENHLDLAEAMYLIRKAGPGRAVLTHLYPDWDDVDLEAEAAKLSPGQKVVRAFDGLKLAVPDKIEN